MTMDGLAMTTDKTPLMDAVGSIGFVECPFPEQIRAALVSNGGMPVKAIVWKRDDDVSYGMFAVEPCGENGQLERHLSVSSSSRGKGRRIPTNEEVEKAAAAVGMKRSECEELRQNQVVHLFRKSG